MLDYYPFQLAGTVAIEADAQSEEPYGNGEKRGREVISRQAFGKSPQVKRYQRAFEETEILWTSRKRIRNCIFTQEESEQIKRAEYQTGYEEEQLLAIKAKYGKLVGEHVQEQEERKEANA